MKQIAVVQQALKEVYTSKKYIFLTIGIAVALFLFNIFINNYRILFSHFSFSFFFSLFYGTVAMTPVIILIPLIVMSIFAGIVIAMAFFLLKRQITQNIGSSVFGIFVSLIAPSCPSCSLGLLGILGLGGVLAFLPFKGVEIAILGIILLSISILYLSKKITIKTCSVRKR